MKGYWKKLFPIGFIAALAAAVYATGVLHYASLDSLRAHHVALKSYVQAHPIAAPLLFIAAFSLIHMTAIPIGSLFALLGGYLFSQPWSTLYSVVGSLFGAIVLYESVRIAAGVPGRNKFAKLAPKIERELTEHAISYLLLVRLIPVISFTALNITAGLVNIGPWTFIWTTLVGLIPSTYAFTTAGEGLSFILDSNQALSFHTIFNANILTAIGILVFLSMLSLLIRKQNHR